MQAAPAQFATQTIRVQFDKDISFGNDVTVRIPKTGDLVNTMFLRVTWPSDLTSAVLQPSVGTAMLNRVELMYKDQVLERHYGETMNMLNEITVPQAKQSALTSLIGKGITSNLASYFIQMPFKTIPLVALDETPTLRIVFNTSNVFTNVMSYTGSVKLDLFVDYVYVSKAEREYMTSTPLSYFTQTFQLVRFRIPVSSYQSTYSLLTQFVNSVSELFWVIQADNASNVYDYTNTSGTDHLVSLRLTGDMNDLITPDYATPLYLRVIQGLEFHTRVPDSQFYMYSFAIAPEYEQATGTLNFSTFDTQQHDLTLTPSNYGREVRIYARSYNVFHVERGQGKVLFQAQEGGPVTGLINGVTTGQVFPAPGNGVFSLYYTGTGGTGALGGTSTVADASGSVYTCGTFSTATMAVYNKDRSLFNTYTKSTGSTNTAYIVRYDQSGTAQWVVLMGGPGSSISNATALRIDSYGDLLVSGTNYSPTITQNITVYSGATAGVANAGTPFGTVFATTAGTYDMFAMKFNTLTGAPQWALPIAGTANGSEGADGTLALPTYKNLLSLSSDLAGNVYVAFTSNSMVVTTSAVSRSTIGTTYNGSTSGVYSPHTYIAQFNKLGTFNWISGVAGTPSGNVFVSSIATSINGLTAVTGYFTSNTFAPFNSAGTLSSGYQLTRSDTTSGLIPTPVNITLPTVNSFVATYTSVGNIQMLAQQVSSNIQMLSVTYDATSNIITCGTVRGYGAVLYNTSAASAPPGLLGISSAFLCPTTTDTYGVLMKYTLSGYTAWTIVIGGASGLTVPSACRSDASSSVYACGMYTCPICTIGTASFTRLGTQDGFVVKYSSTSAYVWSVRIGSAGSTVTCRSIAIDPLTQNVIVSGTYTTTTNPVIVYTSSGVPSGITLPVTTTAMPFTIELKAT
jgi:hypothetical protein